MKYIFCILFTLFTLPVYAQCLVAESSESAVVSGTLTFQIFPGPPNFEDVKKGDKPHPAYILQLNKPICLTDDAFAGEDVSASQIHLMTDSENIESELRGHLGQPVNLNISRAFAQHTAHHKAPILAYVETVSQMSSDSGKTTVEAFYLALAAGSGAEAAKFIIPEKRMKGPFSAQAMTNFYGGLYEPLTLVSVQPLHANQFMVHYRFRQNEKSTCNGRAVVTVENRKAGYLIKGIRTLNGC